MKKFNKYNETNSLLATKLGNEILQKSKNQERSKSRLLNKTMISHYSTFNSIPSKEKFDYNQQNLDSIPNINMKYEHFYDFNKNNLKFKMSCAYSKTVDIHKFNKSLIGVKNYKIFDSKDDDENTHKNLLQLNINFQTANNNPIIIKPFNGNKLHTKPNSFKSNVIHLQNVSELMGNHSFPLEEKHQNLPYGNDIENNNKDLINDHLEKQINFCLEENGIESTDFIKNNSSKRRPPSREFGKSIYD